MKLKLKLNAELSACAHFLENFCSISEAIISNHQSYPSLKFPIQVNPLGTSALFPKIMASSNLEAPSQRLERFGRLAAGHINKNLSEMEKSNVKRNHAWCFIHKNLSSEKTFLGEGPLMTANKFHASPCSLITLTTVVFFCQHFLLSNPLGRALIGDSKIQMKTGKCESTTSLSASPKPIANKEPILMMVLSKADWKTAEAPECKQLMKF